MPTTTYMALTTWPGSTDHFNYTALKDNFVAIDSHDHTSGHGVQIPTAGIADNAVSAAKIAAGAVAPDSLNATAATYSGISTTGTARRGKSIIATTESRTNTAYGTLTTPDQVANIVLPTDGLIFVVYQAQWQESVDGAARAAVFIGSNQWKIATNTADPQVKETALGGGTPNVWVPLASYSAGLTGGGAGFSNAADVTTGQIIGSSSIGGPAVVFAAAGTYTVSVRFKSTSGSVTARDRKLWVWTMGF